MKNTKKTPKLSLSRETVRRLDNDALAGVKGGWITHGWDCSSNKPTKCPCYWASVFETCTQDVC